MDGRAGTDRSALLRSHLPADGAQEGDPADEDLRCLRTSVRVAQEVGARLGEREVLLRPLPRCGSLTRILGLIVERAEERDEVVDIGLAEAEVADVMVERG